MMCNDRFLFLIVVVAVFCLIEKCGGDCCDEGADKDCDCHKGCNNGCDRVNHSCSAAAVRASMNTGCDERERFMNRPSNCGCGC